jgi:hypothetical protein
MEKMHFTGATDSGVQDSIRCYEGRPGARRRERYTHASTVCPTEADMSSVTFNDSEQYGRYQKLKVLERDYSF